jgi:hypothetical protein
MNKELAKFLKWFVKFSLITGTIFLITHFDKVDNNAKTKLVQDFLSIMNSTTHELVVNNILIRSGKVLKDLDPR